MFSFESTGVSKVQGYYNNKTDSNLFSMFLLRENARRYISDLYLKE